MSIHAMSRRRFFKCSAAGAAGLTVLKPGILTAGNSPNNKLNIAIIGVAGRGGTNTNHVKSENIVALCDVDANRLAGAAKEFPGAKTYADWRKCLEQKDIDAVVCSTTDHTHAHVSVWAMNRGMHVYCEKPLANSVQEARMVREVYLKHKGKVATQMGTQMHQTDNYRRVVELVRGGAIGTIKDARVWVGRKGKGGSYLPGITPVPPHLDWDLWLGPSPFHPYNPDYVGHCLKWNHYWDFGSGQLGDMCSHLMDLPYWALDLRFPTSCVAAGEPPHTDTCPVQVKVEWTHPATDKRPALKTYWYDGGDIPGFPSKLLNREAASGTGILFTGDKGWILANYYTRIMMMKGDMTHYTAPTGEKDLIPKSVGHRTEWIQACKTGSSTTCNFDYSGALIEHNLLGCVAYRTGSKLEWDAKNLKATNCPDAEQYVKKTYRKGWQLNG